VEKSKQLIMKKILLIVTVLFCVLLLPAQNTKKTRNTASNTKEAVTERKISSRFNQGLRHYYTAQYEEAMQDFSSILSDAPKHAPSYYMIAKIHTDRQQYSEAENALKQAVKLDKNNIWYQVALAENYIKTQDYKSATPLWEKICAAMPDNAGYLRHLQDCYSHIGKPDKAAEVQARIDKLPASQNDQDLLDANQQAQQQAGDAESHAKMANDLLKTQQYSQAVDEFVESLKLDDTNVEVWQGFITAVEKSQRWNELIRLEEDLTTLFPQSPDMLSALANAFLHTSQPEKAVEYLKQALAFSFDPTQKAQIRQGLRDAYTQLGDTENAERYSR